MPPCRALLPAHIQPERVIATLGLVSDTHAPERLRELPRSLFEALEGVNLVLHAGDVGAFRVLDELSALAPVVAFSGNDGAPEVDRELPLRQVVAVGGQRILLLHGHDPDPEQERAARRGDAWEPKLAQRSTEGRDAGARVVVFGHLHIPLANEDDGVLLVNPGALAAPNARSRQLRRSVALLWVLRGAPPAVVHIDLAAPREAYDAAVDWGAGFAAVAARYGESIVTPELAAELARYRGDGAARVPDSLRAAWLRAAHRVWDGEFDLLTRDALLLELGREPDLSDLPEELRTRLRIARPTAAPDPGAANAAAVPPRKAR